MSWETLGILASVVTAAVLAARELYTTFWVNRKKDQQALNVAKAQQPEIMKQLELGNFKAAAEGITIAQTFVNDQLRFAQGELERLRKREADLEDVVGKKDVRIDELEARCNRLEGKVEALEHMLRECQRKLR